MSETVNKKDLSEADICTKYIEPALDRAGWDVTGALVRKEYTFTAGRVQVRGKLVARGNPRRADYVLFHKPNVPIAIIEAKDNTHSIGAGMQQALDYAKHLDVPFVYSSNGDGFLEHDRLATDGPVERQLSLDEFPTADELWRRYQQAKNLTPDVVEVIEEPYYTEYGGKEPRYYQRVAINRVVEAVARGQRRLLLVMATGTGKTYTAFQIMWRLWKARRARRILFLADRNILVDQAKNNDFRPFGSALTKITHRKADPAYEIHLALYQQLTGPEEREKIYREFSPDFFDLIVIDECHRGSAAEDSAWREILEYFDNAIHLGLTATPKETKYVSNITYFGEPVYTYSLKQGIEDGFLAPYKVVRVDLDKDVLGWRPEAGKVDEFGNPIEDRIYNQKDFDRNLVLHKRTELVAEKVTEFLKGTDRYDKCIVFCEDIDHAERMRSALVNCNADLVQENDKYVVRITGDDPIGKAELDNFIDPEKRYPVIATTSQLMTTGVDAQTCKLIVLDQTIQSMTQFKQIIGRGTRINEDYGKYFFTIMDFRKATNLFADPDFDGEPVVVYKPGPDEPVVPPDETGQGPDVEEDQSDWPDPAGDATDEQNVDEGGGSGQRVKYYVGDVPVYVIAQRVQYYGKDGKLITEEIRDYTKRLVQQEYAGLDQFLKTWSAAERKQAVIDALEQQGVLLEALQKEVGPDYDAFDLICHVAFDQPPLTRKERANNVRKRDYFTKYGDEARKVLDALLDKYADEGIDDLENIHVLQVPPFSELGTPVELIKAFGGREQYLHAVRELENHLYQSG